MSWITPKTDWTNDDEFTYQDYNRIRNNLLYVNDMLNTLYPDKAEIIDLGEAKTGYTNDYYASEFNAFEKALESFTRVGMNMNIGEQMVFQGNTPFINYAELNRIENCSYRWYRIDPVVESATLTPSSFSLNNGATRQLTLTVVPSETSYTVEWESSDNSILTVNQSGLVTSVGTGSATITAKIIQHESVVLSCTSTGTVIIPVTGISVSLNTVSGYKNEEKYIDVIVTPSNATYKDDWTITSVNTGCELTKENGKIKVKFVPFSNEGWNIFTASYVRWREQTGTFRVSLNGFYAEVTTKILVSGSYSNVGSDAYPVYEAKEFQLVKKGANASSNVTLVSLEYVREPYALDDRQNKYRTDMESIENGLTYPSYMHRIRYSQFSDNMVNALKTFYKTVYTNNTGTISYLSKYHILACNEIGITKTMFKGTTELNVPSLGSDSYPYLTTAKNIARNTPEITTRSRVDRQDGDYGIAYINYRTNDSTKDSFLVGIIPDDDSTDFYEYSAVLTNVLGSLKVNYIDTIETASTGEQIPFYEIDWSNTSTTTLYSIPLGSIILDLSGTKS